MDGYKTDQEQVEDIKRWWENNGKSLIVGALIVVTGMVGWRVWDNYKASMLDSASLEYDIVMQHLQQGETEKVLKQGAELIEKRVKTPYAPLVALAMAKIEIEKGALDAAQTRLSWVLDHAVIAEVAHVARLRLARILMAEDKLDEALTHVTLPDVGQFASVYEIIKGDIYAQRGLQDQARTAYNLALASDSGTGVGNETRRLLQIKLDNLGGAELSKPEVAIPEMAAPRVITPEMIAPRVVTPEMATPEVATPEVATPEVATPEVATPEVTTPEVATPEVATPEVATPEVTTPEVTTPEVTTPEVTTPEVTTPEVTTPEVTTPEVTTPEVTTPEAATSETSTSEVVATEPQ